MAYSFSSFTTQTQKALEHLAQELGTLRTGRATTQLLDPVKVEAYGTRMKLNEVANVSAPDPNLLTVTPWDKSLIGEIEKAIASSGLNLNPVVDGTMIRIVVPALTTERRQEMVKILHQRIEAGKVMLRTIRTDIKKEIDRQKGTEGVSEDDVASDLKMLEDKFQEVLRQVDKMAAEKEADLLKI